MPEAKRDPPLGRTKRGLANNGDEQRQTPAAMRLVAAELNWQGGDGC